MSSVKITITAAAFAALSSLLWGCEEGPDDAQAEAELDAELETEALTGLDAPELCELSIDATMGKTKITWRNPYDANIHHFNLYKLNHFDQSSPYFQQSGPAYYKIGEVLATDAFTLSHIDFASQPEAHPERYALSAVAHDGTESSLGAPHELPQLQVSVGVPESTLHLRWNPYLGRQVSEYVIHRGTLPNNMQYLSSVSGAVSQYSDVNIFDSYYYTVEPRFHSGCGQPLNCASGKTATARNLYYSTGTTCAMAVPQAQASLTSYHYRRACQNTYGGTLPSAVLDAKVASCLPSGSTVVVNVDVCCP